MIKEERQQLIIEKLNRDKKINLVDLSQLLNVSYDSIRRDVIELEDKGLLKKVHGGAVANSFLSFKDTKQPGNEELTLIGKKAQKLFENHSTVLLDGGTTNLHIAAQISKTLEMTVITNSPSIAEILSGHPKIEIVLLGGNYHKRYHITVGHELMRQLSHLHPDLAIVGFNGIDLKAGITLRAYEESVLKQKIVSISKKVALCAISEKIGHIENYKICDIQKADLLITSYRPTDEVLLPFRQIIEIW